MLARRALTDREADVNRADPRPAPLAPAPPVEALLELQRSHGNAAVTRMLAPRRIARYRRDVTDYSFNGAGTLFSSQAITPSSPGRAAEAVREHTDITAGGGLEKTRQHFALGANPGQGSWQDDAAGAAAVAANPPIRVSETAKFAVQDVSQPRVFFVDAGIVATTNAALKGGDIRIVLTGGPKITLKTGEELQQAAVQKADEKDPKKVAGPIAEGCNDVANAVMGGTTAGGVDPSLVHGAQPNAAAAPNVGEAFAFQSGFDENAGGGEVMPAKDKERDAMIGAAIAEWQQIEARMEARVDVAHERMSNKAGGMLFGWASHFEGVILNDGGDRLTLVNYNRGTELRHDKKRVFADLYQRVPDFRKRFLALVKEEQRKQQAFDKVSAKKGHTVNPFDWGRVMALMDPLKKELRDTITQATPKQILNDLAEHERLIKEQAPAMWYFDLYGSGKDSFDTRWGAAGSRGAGGSTRVLKG